MTISQSEYYSTVIRASISYHAKIHLAMIEGDRQRVLELSIRGNPAKFTERLNALKYFNLWREEG